MKKLIIVTFLVGIVLRGIYCFYPMGRSAFITVDEAVYGVQSIQIQNGARPVFYPSQVYTGSFSAYLSAFLYSIIGFSPLWLKIVPLVFSIAFIFLTYQIARVVFNDNLHVFLTLLVSSLATPFWNNWSSRAGTGYVEASFLGSLIMLLSLKVVGKESSARLKCLSFFLIGLLSGVGFWIQPTIIYYLIPVALFLAVNFKGLIFEKASYLLVPGFILGDLPVLLYNLTHGSATARTLFKVPWGMKSGLFKLLTEGFPVLVGARTSNSTKDFFTPFSLSIQLLVILAVIFFCFYVLKELKKRFQARTYRLDGQDLIVLVFLSTLTLFLLSTPFNQFSIEPRYVFSLYSTLPLMVPLFIIRICGKSAVRFLLIAVLYFSNWLLGFFIANPLTFTDSYRIDDVLRYLKSNDIDYIISDPALGHRIMYNSKLSVLAAVRGGGITEWRFPKINSEVISVRDRDNTQISFVARRGSVFEQDFERESYAFNKGNFEKVTVDGDFVVLKPRK